MLWGEELNGEEEEEKEEGEGAPPPHTHMDTSWVGLGSLPSCRTMALLLLSVEQLQGSKASNTSEITPSPVPPFTSRQFNTSSLQKKGFAFIRPKHKGDGRHLRLRPLWWTSCLEAILLSNNNVVTMYQSTNCLNVRVFHMVGKTLKTSTLLIFSCKRFHKYLVPLTFWLHVVSAYVKTSSKTWVLVILFSFSSHTSTYCHHSEDKAADYKGTSLFLLQMGKKERNKPPGAYCIKL